VDMEINIIAPRRLTQDSEIPQCPVCGLFSILCSVSLLVRLQIVLNEKNASVY